MNFFRFLVLILVCAAAMCALNIFHARADDDPSKVLVLYNVNYPDENNDAVGDSEELALYYQQKRGIPDIPGPKFYTIIF